MHPTESEVEITQYLRPNGIPRKVYADVGVEKATLVKEHGFILSAEELTTGEIAIYGKLPEQDVEDEITEIAYNGPGENNPTANLIKIIDKLEANRASSQEEPLATQ